MAPAATGIWLQQTRPRRWLRKVGPLTAGVFWALTQGSGAHAKQAPPAQPLPGSAPTAASPRVLAMPGAQLTKGSTNRREQLARMSSRIDELLSGELMSSSQVSVSVRSIDEDSLLYTRKPNVALNPASNIKLLTTAAALSMMGPEHRFRTELRCDEGALRGDTIHGDIQLASDGDPTLVTGDIYELAQRLRTRGIRKITGRILIDPRNFALPNLPPGFEQKQEFASYRAPGGATAVNFNTYVLWISPGATPGSPGKVHLEPPVRVVEIVNQTTTVAGRRGRPKLQIDREGKTPKITITGKLGVDAPVHSFRYPTYESEAYAAMVLRLALKQAGIRLGRAGHRVIDRNAAVKDHKVLASHRSESLTVLIRAVNKQSNNFVAEQILRALDPERPATVDGSLSAVREFARHVGVEGHGLRIGNGSGLYDNNRISSAQVTQVLSYMHRDFRHRPDYISSLAIMGVDGTTRKRLTDSSSAGWIRAKTGTLDGVSALSGYAGAPGAPPVAFSILVNGFSRWKIGAVRRVQNAIAETIVFALAGQLEPSTSAGSNKPTATK